MAAIQSIEPVKAGDRVRCHACYGEGWQMVEIIEPSGRRIPGAPRICSSCHGERTVAVQPEYVPATP